LIGAAPESGGQLTNKVPESGQQLTNKVPECGGLCLKAPV